MDEQHDETLYSCIPQPVPSSMYGEPDQHISSSHYQHVRNNETSVQNRQHSVGNNDGSTSEYHHPHHNHSHPLQCSNTDTNAARSDRKRTTHHPNNNDNVPAHHRPAKISRRRDGEAVDLTDCGNEYYYCINPDDDGNTKNSCTSGTRNTNSRCGEEVSITLPISSEDKHSVLEPRIKKSKQQQQELKQQYHHQQQQQQPTQKEQHPPPHYQHQYQTQGKKQYHQHPHPQKEQIHYPDPSLPPQQHQHHHYYNNHFHYHEPGGELGKGTATNSQDTDDHDNLPEKHQHEHRPAVNYIVITEKQMEEAKRKASAAAAAAHQQVLQGSKHRKSPTNMSSASAHHDTAAKANFSVGNHPSINASTNHNVLHNTLMNENEQVPTARARTNTSSAGAVHHLQHHGAGHPTTGTNRKNATKEKCFSDQQVEQARAKASEAASATYQQVLRSYGPGHNIPSTHKMNQGTPPKGGLSDQQVEQARAKASKVASATYQNVLHSYGPGYHIPSTPTTNQGITPSWKCLRDQQVEQAEAKASEAASAAYQRALQDHGAGWYCNGQMPASLAPLQPLFDYPEPPTGEYPFLPGPSPPWDNHSLLPPPQHQHQQPDAIISHGQDESHCVYPHSDPAVAGFPMTATPQAATPDQCHEKETPKNMKHWDEMFDHLQCFYHENGHAHVPYRYEEKDLLGAWVQNQRNRQVALSPLQIQKLESLKFDWLKYPRKEANITWNRNLQRLVAFHYHYGHCDVADCILNSYEDYSKLSVWVHEQKLKKKRGEAFSEYQLEQLALLDFKWESKP